MTRSQAIALITAKTVFGAGMAAGLMLSPATHAHAGNDSVMWNTLAIDPSQPKGEELG